MIHNCKSRQKEDTCSMITWEDNEDNIPKLEAELGANELLDEVSG